MKQFKNILYAADASQQSIQGLKQAFSLSRNHEASLTLLALYPTLPSKLESHKAPFEEFLKQKIEADLKAANEVVPTDLSQITRIIKDTDSPLAIELIRHAIRSESDLIIKEAEPKKTEGFKAFDMTLLRKAPCPVWLSRPIDIPRENIRVCVAIDPLDEEDSLSELSMELLQTARLIADSCSGTLEIVSFWEYAYESYISHNVRVDVSSQEVAQALQGAQSYHYGELNKLIKSSGISGKQNIHHLRGKASELLGDFAKEKKIDIMVMGTVSRTGIAGFFIGNTAENVFEELTCSLLALKPRGFVSPIKPYN